MTTTPNLTIYKGNDIIIKVTVQDQDGVAKDVTGATINFRIGSVRAQSFVLTKTGTITNGPTGLIQVALTNTDTDTLDIRTYDWQMQVEDASGDAQVVKEGIVNVKYRLPGS